MYHEHQGAHRGMFYVIFEAEGLCWDSKTLEGGSRTKSDETRIVANKIR
jgi:hypothetical protein